MQLSPNSRKTFEKKSIHRDLIFNFKEVYGRKRLEDLKVEIKFNTLEDLKIIILF